MGRGRVCLLEEPELNVGFGFGLGFGLGLGLGVLEYHGSNAVEL